MHKSLLVDTMPFEVTPEQITESIKEHNGKLSVDSDNQGTVFTIQLPVKHQVEKTA